ncbi:hypothetical protein FRC11_011044, partial [Ceratobasidium sp. 423]
MTTPTRVVDNFPGLELLAWLQPYETASATAHGTANIQWKTPQAGTAFAYCFVVDTALGPEVT